MTVLAGITNLGFEPKMGAAMDAVATTATPINMQPKLGPLANLSYKPTSWRYLVRLSSAPTVGTASVRLMAGATVIKSQDLAIVGATAISDNVPVNMSAVAGETPLSVEVDVTGAADAGITATVDAWLDIEQPLTITGC